MHTSLFSLCSYVAVLTSYGKEGKKIRHYCLSLKMVFVFHAVKSLIDSICMDLQSTKVIFFAFWSASMGDYNSNRIIMIENTMNKIKKMIAVSSHLLVWRWQNVFSSSSNAGLFILSPNPRLQAYSPSFPASCSDSLPANPSQAHVFSDILRICDCAWMGANQMNTTWCLHLQTEEAKTEEFHLFDRWRGDRSPRHHTANETRNDMVTYQIKID